jgi:antitoxin component of RelBE/YafQ-DinJ toxin-antitoxin module
MKMTKDASLTLQIDQSLHDEFMAAAEASDQSPSKVFRDLMQDFILQQSMAPDYSGISAQEGRHCP